MMEDRGRGHFYFTGNYLCVDFINTEVVAEGRPASLLADFDDLMSWLAEAKVLTRRKQKQSSRLGVAVARRKRLWRALDFRATLRNMVERLVKGKSVPAVTIALIKDLLNNQVGYAELRRTRGGFEKRIHENFNEPGHLLLPIVESACDLLCYSDFALIKKCENDACGLFFYDTTKNHSRRWCSMSACGNRMKVAAHYRPLRGTNAT